MHTVTFPPRVWPLKVREITLGLLHHNVLLQKDGHRRTNLGKVGLGMGNAMNSAALRSGRSIRTGNITRLRFPAHAQRSQLGDSMA